MVPTRSRDNGLQWPQLFKGTLINRYKRFLADVELDNGNVVTAHCTNSGAMTTCCQPGRPVYLSYHDTPRRKLKYTWELIDMPSSLVGVNTLLPNRLVAKSVREQTIPELTGYHTVKPEVKVGTRSRLDLMLTDDRRPPCYVEIKNCSLVEKRTALFPDAVTSRGLKHLEELMALATHGARCVMFYLIQRMDADRFRPADSIDPRYGEGLRQAAESGIEILVYDVAIDLESIRINRAVPVDL